MFTHRLRLQSPGGKLAFALVALFMLTLMQAQAATGVPISLAIEPGTVKQGDDGRTYLKTTVTLQAPSPTYFICEVRSQDKHKLECSTIIFKKGDLQGKGYATVFWSGVSDDTSVKVKAFNVEAPDVAVSFTVQLQVKGNP